MSSPFPGMDPYLETTWGDVHTSLVTYARDQLRRQLPPDLKVRVEEHVAVELEEEPGHGFYPDVRIIEWAPEAQEQAKSGADVALSEPLIVPTIWVDWAPAKEKLEQLHKEGKWGLIWHAKNALEPFC